MDVITTSVIMIGNCNRILKADVPLSARSNAATVAAIHVWFETGDLSHSTSKRER